MTDHLPLGEHGALPLSELTIRSSRSSGPGGQHANVTASRVEVVFDVAASTTLSAAQKDRIIGRLGTRVVAVAQDARSQSQNRELALTRLQVKLERALRVSPPRRATQPTAASEQRWEQDKRLRAASKRLRQPPDASEG